MFYKYFIRYIDIVLFWILLIYDFENIIAFFDASKESRFFDLIFNMWFILLVFIIYRRSRNQEFLNSILYDLGLKSK